MARIPLRTYNREVENLIERGQIEEAIAHCKNILKQFPKHIETYRLLGKSFLESQRYAEAADILQRVLSVFPDDFVSQLGMSIIREDEGNLDAAIWHMERAYEVQPFNRPVQDELRRLYGRRDGAEPPRIRLTRGALVRMYARGDLYPQAIAEIRAAQAEDPSRIDLIVLLAKMYYLSGQKIEATEISSSLITKLPYSYEANRILMEVLPATSRADDARIFQQRLFSLDPYAAFISPNAPTSSQVPEQTVMVEKVDWQPSMTDAQAPDWAKTIGVDWEETSEENLPDWLTTIQPGQAESFERPAAPEMVDEQPAAVDQPGDELIPEFLKDAGWEPSDGTLEDQQLSLEEQESTEGEGEIVEAEIPEWLQSLAPDAAVTRDADETTNEEDQMGWLEGILPAGTAAATAAVIADEFTQPEETQIADGETPVLSEEFKGELQQGNEQAEWLQDLTTDTIQPTDEQAPEVEDAADVPDWLAELSAAPQEITAGEEISTEALPAIVSEEIPDWITQDETEELVSEAAADTVETTSETVEVQETVPDWLAELSTDAPLDTTAGEEISEAEMPAAATDEIPDWIKQAETEEPVGQLDADQLETMAEAEADEESVPDWLTELKQETPAETAAISKVEAENVAQDSLEIPAFEAEAWAPEEQGSSEMPTQDASGEQEVAESAPDAMDIDAAMAWMEALAARQGADADSLQISQPEERSETPPEWLQKESVQAEEALPEIIAEESAFAEEIPATTDELIEPVELSEQTPINETDQPVSSLEVEETTAATEGDLDSALAWMETLAARQGADEEALKIIDEQRTETPPEWITQLEETPHETLPDAISDSIPDTASENIAEVEEKAQALEAISGLDEAAAELTGIQEEIQSEEMPTDEISSVELIETPPQEIKSEVAPDVGAMDVDAAFAWLESLAAKQGAEEGSLVTAPDERPETPPDWVSDTIQEPPLEERDLVLAVGDELSEVSADLEEETTLEIPTAEVTSPLAEEYTTLEEVAAPESPSEEVTPQAAKPTGTPEAEIPDWLRSYEEEQRAQEPVWKPDESFTPEAVAEEELPDWLIEEAPETPVAESTLPEPDLAEQAAAEMPAADGVSDMPEWLKALQESQPVQEAPETSTQPESTWVQEYTPEPAAPVIDGPHAAPPASDALALAQATLRSGDIESAAEQYTQIINSGQNQDMVIQDLKNALDQYPVDVSLWQALGDVYIRSNRVQEALDAYTKAEELLR